MRRALQLAAGTCEPNTWSAREVLGRAERYRRNRRIAIVLPMACAVVSVAAVMGGDALGLGGSRPPVNHYTVSLPVLPATMPLPRGDWPSVRVVKPGQVLDLGGGRRMRLTRTERCFGTPSELSFNCKSVVDGNQPAGTVGVQASGTFYSPLYIGDGPVARMTLTSGGVTYQVHVVTLAGHPGYATGYVWGAPTTGFPVTPVVKVYDAAGKVLAHL